MIRNVLDGARRAALEPLLAPFDPLPLECDGFARVAHFVLNCAQIRHSARCGYVCVHGQRVAPHFWIEFADGLVADFRLRMWCGPDAPHGVFRPSAEVEYAGEEITLRTSSLLFAILTDGRPFGHVG